MIEMFDNSERLVINSIGSEMRTDDFTKQFFLQTIRFQKETADDKAIKRMLESLESKADSLSDDEWAYISLMLPLPTTIELDEVYVDTDEISSP